MAKNIAKSKLKSILKDIKGKDFWIDFAEGSKFIPENYLLVNFRINDEDCIVIELAEMASGEQEYKIYKCKYRGPELLDDTIKII